MFSRLFPLYHIQSYNDLRMREIIPENPDRKYYLGIEFRKMLQTVLDVNGCKYTRTFDFRHKILIFKQNFDV